MSEAGGYVRVVRVEHGDLFFDLESFEEGSTISSSASAKVSKNAGFGVGDPFMAFRARLRASAALRSFGSSAVA